MDPVLTSVNFGLFLTISTQLEYTETFGCPRSDISIKFGHNISTNYFSTNHLAAAGNESFLTGDKSEKARTCKQTRQASARRPENRAVSLARLTLSFPFRIRPLHILLSFALHLHVFASPLLSHCIAFRLPHGTRHPHWWFILYALLTLLLQAYCRLVRLTRHFL